MQTLADTSSTHLAPLSAAVWPAPVLPRAGLLCGNMVYSSPRLRGGLPYLTGRKEIVPEKENMNTHEFMFHQSRKEWGRTEDRAGIKFYGPRGAGLLPV